MSERNFWFLLRQNFVYGILAVGMTFVILTGGIDLSVGSVVAFAGMVGAAVAKGSNWRDVSNPDPGGSAVLLAVLAAVAVGAGAGLIHGFAIAKLRVPAFVVTLGGLAAWRGATQVMSQGTPINTFSDDYRFWLGFRGTGAGAGADLRVLRRRRVLRAPLYDVRPVDLRRRR
jgi:ribose/xylose/arabinose/galactoside ABC-type transport system permease subunit